MDANFVLTSGGALAQLCAEMGRSVDDFVNEAV